LLARGREPLPREVRLTTYTLRYPSAAWVQIDGLERHWERADVQARLEEPGTVTVHAKNVSALKLTLPNLHRVVIEGQRLNPPKGKSSAPVRLEKKADRWTLSQASYSLGKHPGLTGPIDDAFMDSFVFVRPTGKPFNDKVGSWAQAELAHATKMWRDIFRGDAPVKDDTAVNDEDIASRNLVLWGDPQSNKLLARIAKKLPVKWDAKTIRIGNKSYDSASHIPLLIYPNPLNPQRYVLVNSGFTFAHEGAASNAKQTPKLPDYAVLSIDLPDNPSNALRRTADGAPYHNVVQAGFFDESWQVENSLIWN